MKVDIHIIEHFGTHLADGSEAAQFRMKHIDPYVDVCRAIVLDFTGVRNANSSFVNALVASLVEQHGLQVLRKLIFKGCNPSVQVLIGAAVELGASKIANSCHV